MQAIFSTSMSATGESTVSPSVALLVLWLSSITPLGAVTVAVLTTVPVMPGLRVPVAWKVTVEPTGRFTDCSRSPLPPKQVAPPVNSQVKVTFSSWPGKMSST